VPGRIITGEAAKLAAFRRARAALAASGTVSLELALAGVPMVIAYKVSKLEEQLKYVIRASSIVLPNLVLGENVVPEFLQADAGPARLATALAPLLEDGPARAAQLAGLARVDAAMRLPGAETPSGRAADVVLAAARR
jgi:lipid-A-disaccharide synthase